MTFRRDMKIEDCTFSVVVRSSLGDRKLYYTVTIVCLRPPAISASACSFLLVSDYAVPLQCL